VRGRFALDVRWVKEVLPDYYKDKRLPVMVRALDPINVLQANVMMRMRQDDNPPNYQVGNLCFGLVFLCF
jgi:hypothetical protein